MPGRKRGHGARALAVLVAAVALFLQVFVVQTHTHARAQLGALNFERLADHAKDGQAQASATHEQGGCIICEVFASSGQSITPDSAILTATHSAASETAALAIRRAPRALTHSWQSRAPPIAL